MTRPPFDGHSRVRNRGALQSHLVERTLEVKHASYSERYRAVSRQRRIDGQWFCSIATSIGPDIRALPEVGSAVSDTNTREDLGACG